MEEKIMNIYHNLKIGDYYENNLHYLRCKNFEFFYSRKKKKNLHNCYHLHQLQQHIFLHSI